MILVSQLLVMVEQSGAVLIVVELLRERDALVERQASVAVEHCQDKEYSQFVMSKQAVCFLASRRHDMSLTIARRVRK